MQKPKDVFKAFQSIWKAESKDYSFEKDALEVFFNKTNLLIEKKQFKLTFEMLLNFTKNMHKRDINNLVFDKFISNSLQLHIVLKKIFDNVKNSKARDKTEYAYLDATLRKSRLLIIHLIDILLKNKNAMEVPMVFEKLYNLTTYQLKQYKDIVKNTFFSYYENGIPKLIFENPNREIYLPSKWQITEENVKSRNEFAILWLYNFLEWIYRKTREILYADVKNDKELLPKSFETSQKISINLEMLFPQYDRRILFDIFLLFVWCNIFRDYEDVTSLHKLMIQTSYFISPPISFSTAGELSDKEKQRETSTIVFASIPLKNKIVNIPIKKLQECIKEIENIECKSKVEVARKKRLARTYNALLKSL